LSGRFLLLSLILTVVSCAPQPISTQTVTPASLTSTSLPSTAREAYDVLVKFLSLLHDKKYTEAVPLYGGEYEQLQVFNPQLDPADRVGLWEWACDNQLLQCLELRSATFQELRGASYVFQVEFSRADGSLFVLGPCCGADETEMPPVSQFEFMVSPDTEHRFVVMNTPPYVP
jgi:hypothetical protein